MNIGAHPLAFQQGFWPFQGCSVHPAFLHTQYSSLHHPHQGNFPSKSSAFTIDAILNRDHVEESQTFKSPNATSYSSSHCKETDTSFRRQQRLYDGSHPYLSPKDKATAIKKVTELYGKILVIQLNYFKLFSSFIAFFSIYIMVKYWKQFSVLNLAYKQSYKEYSKNKLRIYH